MIQDITFERGAFRDISHIIPRFFFSSKEKETFINIHSYFEHVFISGIKFGLELREMVAVSSATRTCTCESYWSGILNDFGKELMEYSTLLRVMNYDGSVLGLGKYI